MKYVLALRLIAIAGALMTVNFAGADVRGNWKKDLYPVDQRGKWGYIDASGKLVIKPKFEEAAYFSEGLAYVKLNGKYGYIDRAGTGVIAPRFDQAFSFREGVAWVQGPKQGFIDKTGKIVITAPPGTYCREFRYGLALAMPLESQSPTGPGGGVPEASGKAPTERPKYGYIDKTGKYAIDPQFDDAHDFEFGMAAACLDKKWGFIDRKGKFVLPPEYDDASYISEGAAAVKVHDHYILITKAGKRINNVDYEEAAGFVEGLAPVKLQGRWGFVDKTGQNAISICYDQVSSYFNGLATVMLNGKYGVINKKGLFVVQPKYLYAHFFLGELAAVTYHPEVSDGTGTGYINRNGREVWKPIPLVAGSVRVSRHRRHR